MFYVFYGSLENVFVSVEHISEDLQAVASFSEDFKLNYNGSLKFCSNIELPFTLTSKLGSNVESTIRPQTADSYFKRKSLAAKLLM